MRSRIALKILLAGLLITMVYVPTASAQPSGTRYLGCFKDTYDRDLSGESQQQNQLTLQGCADSCRQKGFKYAAAQFGTYCFCGNSYGKHGKAANCDMNCGGNSNEICGGPWANSVYELFPSSVSHTSDYDVTPIGEYKGCYLDNENDRDLTGTRDFVASMTLDICADMCRKQGYLYAGAQYAQHCFCGNSYGKYGMSANCKMPCAGNKNQICGGSLANSVYAVSGSTTSTGANLGATGTSTTAGTTPAPPGQIDLTGVWRDNNGATYSIRQMGNKIWWYMDGRPRYTNVFKGNKSGNSITGEWCDVPGGKLGTTSGSLTLKIINNDRLEKVSASPAYGGSSWMRLYWNASP